MSLWARLHLQPLIDVRLILVVPAAKLYVVLFILPSYIRPDINVFRCKAWRGEKCIQLNSFRSGDIYRILQSCYCSTTFILRCVVGWISSIFSYILFNIIADVSFDILTASGICKITIRISGSRRPMSSNLLIGRLII